MEAGQQPGQQRTGLLPTDALANLTSFLGLSTGCVRVRVRLLRECPRASDAG